ncbi:transposase [Chryseobacterium lathyri]|uniref:transposase n=1 Tax=Chryseobacterium lathyri TaxID=395933 RepID=UPI001CC087BD|nr:transposase [Chryseobacterium lathyri]
MNFKEIHIGALIKQRVAEHDIEIPRICNFFKCTEAEIEEMLVQENLSTDLVLKWCKLLEYDFFRIYSHHLMLYSSPSTIKGEDSGKEKSSLPEFRKNIYTKEIIEFILELIKTGKKSKYQIVNEYKIPKTTLYRWIEKYMKE